MIIETRLIASFFAVNMEKPKRKPVENAMIFYGLGKKEVKMKQ